MKKEEVLAACIDAVNKRLKEVELAIESSNSSLIEDTKSSAGDKYETGREMIQQDLNRYQQQLVLAESDLQVLERIEHLKATDNVAIGSLLETNKGWYFIAVSIGKLVGFNNLFVVSPQAPIGKIFIGRKVGDVISFNGQEFEIRQLV